MPSVAFTFKLFFTRRTSAYCTEFLKMSVKTRFEEVDFLRGAAIVMIVLGHAIIALEKAGLYGSAIVIPDAVILFFYAIHMPIIFAVSGYVSNDNKKGRGEFLGRHRRVDRRNLARMVRRFAAYGRISEHFASHGCARNRRFGGGGAPFAWHSAERGVDRLRTILHVHIRSAYDCRGGGAAHLASSRPRQSLDCRPGLHCLRRRHPDLLAKMDRSARLDGLFWHTSGCRRTGEGVAKRRASVR
jgi:hypothetical protein